MSGLRVLKRDGNLEEVDFGKVTNRIRFLCHGVLKDGTVIGDALKISYGEIARNVISTITDGVSTRELDEYAAQFCAGRIDESYEYSMLAGRIAISNHQKNTLGSFADTVKLLYENCDPQGNRKPLLRKSFVKTVMTHRDQIEEMIDYSRDYRIDDLGYKTLNASFFLRRQVTPTMTVCERPQHMYMRVAIALHSNDDPHQADLAKIKETYDLLSLGFLSHASPTMYNAGTTTEQLSSCFLLGIKDSMDEAGGIPDCWKSCAMISKRAGGIGVGITPIRGTGSLIRGVNGPSDGLVPMIRVFNDIARYVNQGGRRKGAFAMYLEPWHADIRSFLDLRKNNGKEEQRARDLFYGLWIPDLFMKRLNEATQQNKPVKWSLFCPDSAHVEGNKRLYDCYGPEFEQMYQDYEQRGLATEVIPDIRDLWFAILTSQKETGTPYMLYKDHVNSKNAQANLGVIRNSNLCAEIVEYSDEQEHAVCNLASIVLSRFVKERDGQPHYDFEHLRSISYTALKNLDRVIDINLYPTPETERSNLRHRPVGLGVQGLADAFILMRYPYDSPEASRLNRQIFETIYYGAMQASADLAQARHQIYLDHKDQPELLAKLGFNQYELPLKVYPGAYSSFEGSPLSQGQLQFDMWQDQPDEQLDWDWTTLRQQIAQYGVRNSLTTALMPTASTASILKSVECMEPLKSNLYTRRVLGGEAVVLNRYLERDLTKLKLWTPELKRQLVANRGSVQNIEVIPDHLKQLYKTAFEIKQRVILNMARDRAPFIDQTQSMNLFVDQPTDKILTSIHLYGWKCGLKTGMYYLRRMPKAKPIQFTVDHIPTPKALTPKEADETAECDTCGA